jgi:hypothetical protein
MSRNARAHDASAVAKERISLSPEFGLPVPSNFISVRGGHMKAQKYGTASPDKPPPTQIRMITNATFVDLVPAPSHRHVDRF